MFHATALVLAALACGSSLAFFQFNNNYINPHQKNNELFRYERPLYCHYRSLYFAGTYNTGRGSFTERYDTDCCYWAHSRNKCCMDVTRQNGVTTETCRCSPNIDCGASPTTQASATTQAPTTAQAQPTTTQTPTTPGTTTPIQTLCPLTYRVLNGELMGADCPYTGIANISTLISRVSACNAVFVAATVNGQLKPTFLTTQFCINMVNEVPNVQFNLEFGGESYFIPSPTFQLISGTNGVAYVDVDVNILSGRGPCQDSACAYDNATMFGLINYSNCKVLSYGASNEGTLDQTGLNVVDLQLYTAGCANIPDLFGAANTMCFRSTSGENVACSGDAGAPVYCNAPITNEWILIGITAFRGVCDGEPDVKVLPFTG